MIDVDPAVPGTDLTILAIYENGRLALSLPLNEARALAFAILKRTEPDATAALEAKRIEVLSL
jgi:hypothetical protein